MEHVQQAATEPTEHLVAPMASEILKGDALDVPLTAEMLHTEESMASDEPRSPMPARAPNPEPLQNQGTDQEVAKPWMASCGSDVSHNSFGPELDDTARVKVLRTDGKASNGSVSDAEADLEMEALAAQAKNSGLQVNNASDPPRGASPMPPGSCSPLPPRALNPEPPEEEAAFLIADSQGQASCPGGHALVAFVTENRSYFCDGCGQSMLVGETLHGCRTCDFDLCEQCQVHFPRQAQADDAHPSDVSQSLKDQDSNAAALGGGVEARPQWGGPRASSSASVVYTDAESLDIELDSDMILANVLQSIHDPTAPSPIPSRPANPEPPKDGSSEADPALRIVAQVPTAGIVAGPIGAATALVNALTTRDRRIGKMRAAISMAQHQISQRERQAEELRAEVAKGREEAKRLLEEWLKVSVAVAEAQMKGDSLQESEQALSTRLWAIQAQAQIAARSTVVVQKNQSKAMHVHSSQELHESLKSAGSEYSTVCTLRDLAVSNRSELSSAELAEFSRPVSREALWSRSHNFGSQQWRNLTYAPRPSTSNGFHRAYQSWGMRELTPSRPASVAAVTAIGASG